MSHLDHLLENHDDVTDWLFDVEPELANSIVAEYVANNDELRQRFSDDRKPEQQRLSNLAVMADAEKKRIKLGRQLADAY